VRLRTKACLISATKLHEENPENWYKFNSLGKYQTQTRVLLVGGMLEEMGLNAGLYLYDRRVWLKMLPGKIQNGTLSLIALLTNSSICIFFGNPALRWSIGPGLARKSGLTGVRGVYGKYLL